MRYARFGLLILYLFVFSFSCSGYKQRAKGVENQITVFTSEDDRPIIASAFESIFNRAVFTPEPEPYFELEYLNPSDFNQFKYNHNIIVVSLFTPEDTTGDNLVRSILPENQLDLVIQDKNKLFATRDFFARGQVFAILAANDEDDLIHALQERGQWLYSQFDHALMERIQKHVFSSTEQKKLSKKLREDYGWYIRLQRDYTIINEKPEKNFVWLGRSFPYRWLSVQWMDNPRIKSLDPQMVIELVQNYPDVFYKNVRFTGYYRQMEEVPLDRWTAWRVEGLWEHKSEARGGPFISYLFYENTSNRIFHINCLIFNPGGKKVLLLRQMETMIQTFSVESS